jgi:hypothetical protein
MRKKVVASQINKPFRGTSLRDGMKRLDSYT